MVLSIIYLFSIIDYVLSECPLQRLEEKSLYLLLLKVLISDKLSGDGQIFQVWPYLNSLIMKKLPFSQQEHLQIFPTSLAK